jgi:hypothetical protein
MSQGPDEQSAPDKRAAEANAQFVGVPITKRLKVAIAALVGAFVIAMAGAAGTQFYGLLSAKILPSPSAAAQATGAPTPDSSPTPSPAASPLSKATPTAQVPTATDVRLFQPFTPSGLRPQYRVVSKDHGVCNGSYVSQDPDALHCFGESDDARIYDVCIPDLDDERVVCFDDPWTLDVVDFKVDKREPRDGSLNPQPWALELAVPGSEAPVRCVFISGVTGFVAGERIMYQCGSIDQETYVVGEVKKPKGKPWLVYYSSASSPDTVQVPVRAAWK